MPAPTVVYPALERYRLELPADTVVFEAGVVPPYFYIMLSGQVLLEREPDADGARAVAADIQPGAVFGVVSAFSGRPAETRARATMTSAALALPVSAATAAFQQVPDLAVAIIRQLAAESGGGTASAVPVIVAASVYRTQPIRLATKDRFNEEWFFLADIRCPACERDFASLRVRQSAVHPAGRDSDFRISYETVDPSLYAVTVCPHCAYAAYAQDFADLAAHERRTILAAQTARFALLRKDLSRERDLSDAMVALQLARMCAETRGSGQRRLAGLLHRAAWIERARGNAEAERALLQRTRDAYIEVFEQDTEVQDAAAVRVAYLLGDLSLRLGEVSIGRRWLLECARMPAAKEQVGLVRMARERLKHATEMPELQRPA